LEVYSLKESVELEQKKLKEVEEYSRVQFHDNAFYVNILKHLECRVAKANLDMSRLEGEATQMTNLKSWSENIS